MENCLLSIDLNTTRITNQNYNNLLQSIKCDNLQIHIYNYIKAKHSKIAFNNGEVLHQYAGSRKKIAMDITQALDITEQASNKTFDKIFILCGEYESEFLFSKLDQMQANYHKISPSDLRQLNDDKIDINIPTSAPNNLNLSPEQLKTLIKYIKLKKESNISTQWRFICFLCKYAQLFIYFGSFIKIIFHTKQSLVWKYFFIQLVKLKNLQVFAKVFFKFSSCRKCVFNFQRTIACSFSFHNYTIT